MSEPVVIRKNPIIMVWNLLAVQIAASGLYSLAGSVAYYAKIWRGLPVAESISFELAQVIFIFAMEAALIMVVFLVWWRQVVRITPEQLQEHGGLLFREHKIIPRIRITAAIFKQNILGKLLHYGTVILEDAQGSILAKLRAMPEPEKFVDMVMGREHNDKQLPEMPDDPQALMKMAEHERLERKSTLRWDLAAGKVNRNLERATMKTVAAFLNTDGGSLLIGVGDDNSIVGLEHDYATLNRKDADGFINHFGNVFNSMVGPHLRHLVQLRPFEQDGKECMLVSVSPSSKPAYLNEEDREEFFVRTGNGTTALKVSEAAAYIETRWQK